MSLHEAENMAPAADPQLWRHKPEWLKIRLPKGQRASGVAGELRCAALHTICTSGLCPNRGECWGRGTATFMIGGDHCTRACRFCNVATGHPSPLDPDEPQKVAHAIAALGIKHAVVTSVDRDDLPDGGAAHWARTIRAIRQLAPGVTLETLIPDFRGRHDLLDIIADERPEVVSHNLETVERLTPAVRSVATYRGSLEVLSYLASKGLRTKSGIMLGLGETHDEILTTMDHLLQAGCQVMTIGQYLQPTQHHYPVQEYVHPEVFARYAEIGRQKGFRHIESAPLVRSSYHAERHLL